MAPQLNREWHAEHRLGSGASLEDRVQWHLDRADACGCRPIPVRILEEIERRRALP
jgi:hypothetical protein